MLRLLLILFCISSLLAEEKVTPHTLLLDGQPLNYIATVTTGKVSYISYIKESEENRPITFVFNGGPGSSSCFLHMAALGPRIFVGPEEGGKLVPPYKIADNMETILDLTDLIFIDPSGTGFSSSDGACYSIQGDIESVAEFIRDYLTQNGRWNSPKYIAGESYGGMRAIGLADFLQHKHGIYLNGLIFVSAAIDFQVFFFENDNQLPYFLFLPSYATTAWYHGKAHTALSLEEAAQKARQFVYQTYAPSLICPKCTDREMFYPQLAEMTGLTLDEIELYRGKIKSWDFSFSLLHEQRKMVGRFDSRVTGYYNSHDPSSARLEGALSGALHEYLHKELGFKNSYTLFSEEVHEQWDYWNYNEWGYPNLMDALRRACFGNPSMKIFVGCGYFDLATPFATVEYCFEHLDVPDISIQMEYYEGGHMYYTNPKARIKFKQDLTRFYR